MTSALASAVLAPVSSTAATMRANANTTAATATTAARGEPRSSRSNSPWFLRPSDPSSDPLESPESPLEMWLSIPSINNSDNTLYAHNTEDESTSNCWPNDVSTPYCELVSSASNALVSSASNALVSSASNALVSTAYSELVSSGSPMSRQNGGENKSKGKGKGEMSNWGIEPATGSRSRNARIFDIRGGGGVGGGGGAFERYSSFQGSGGGVSGATTSESTRQSTSQTETLHAASAKSKVLGYTENNNNKNNNGSDGSGQHYYRQHQNFYSDAHEARLRSKLSRCQQTHGKVS